MKFVQTSRVGRPLKHSCVGYANWAYVGVEHPAECFLYRSAFWTLFTLPCNINGDMDSISKMTYSEYWVVYSVASRPFLKGTEPFLRPKAPFIMTQNTPCTPLQMINVRTSMWFYC